MKKRRKETFSLLLIIVFLTMVPIMVGAILADGVSWGAVYLIGLILGIWCGIVIICGVGYYLRRRR